MSENWRICDKKIIKNKCAIRDSSKLVVARRTLESEREDGVRAGGARVHVGRGGRAHSTAAREQLERRVRAAHHVLAQVFYLQPFST